MWWHMPLQPALERQRGGFSVDWRLDCLHSDFQDSSGYVEIQSQKYKTKKSREQKKVSQVKVAWPRPSFVTNQIQAHVLFFPKAANFFHLFPSSTILLQYLLKLWIHLWVKPLITSLIQFSYILVSGNVLKGTSFDGYVLPISVSLHPDKANHHHQRLYFPMYLHIQPPQLRLVPCLEILLYFILYCKIARELFRKQTIVLVRYTPGEGRG